MRQVKIALDTKTVAGAIPPDFIGFGYETSAVAQTNYFRGDNRTLIRLYRQLGSNGLIRIGGNISDHTRYVPDGTSAVNTERAVTVVNRRNLEDLAAFARATGWKVMWGLNLGTDSKEAAAQEAVDELMAALQGVTIPRPLISQHLGHLESLVADGSVAPQARALLLASVTRVLDIYADAIDSASQN